MLPNANRNSGLLTQLHWSLPRPLSTAEKQLSADLEVMGSRQVALEASWAGLKRRTQQLVAMQARSAMQAGGASAASPVSSAAIGTPGSNSSRRLLTGTVKMPGVRYWRGGPVTLAGAHSTPSAKQTPPARIPPAQLQAVQAAIMDHMAAISGCSSEVDRLQHHFQRWMEVSDAVAAAADAAVPTAAVQADP